MKTILTPQEVCEQFFNGHVSYWTLLEMAKTNKIPSFKVGRKYFFDLDALNEWTRSQQIPA